MKVAPGLKVAPNLVWGECAWTARDLLRVVPTVGPRDGRVRFRFEEDVPLVPDPDPGYGTIVMGHSNMTRIP